MADHVSGIRAMADPVIDITDMYVFPSPERPGVLVLVLDVFPFAAPGVLFSDAIDYQFRLRPLTIATSGAGAAFAVGDDEYRVICRFSVPAAGAGVGTSAQECTCSTSTGLLVSFPVNDEQGGQLPGLRAFAGLRMDPFFFDSGAMLKTIKARQLSFEPVGNFLTSHQNVLSVVVELDVASFFQPGQGPLWAVVGETIRPGSIPIRLERFGRPEIKNVIMLPQEFDPINRGIDIRDLYNQEDAFKLGRAYLAAFRSRINANLAFYDSLDGKTDWPLDAQSNHPLTDLLLADFMVVDVSKPFGEQTYFEIEHALLQGAAHQTCGGRWLNDDIVDTLLTLLVNAGKGPRISDGVDQAAVPATHVFPYLVAPEPNPRPLNIPTV